MSTTSQQDVTTSHWEADWDIWRCLTVRGRLEIRQFIPSPGLCSGCANRLPIENDILVAKQPDHRQQPGRPAVLR